MREIIKERIILSTRQISNALIIIFIIALLMRFLVTVYLNLTPSLQHRVYSGDSLIYNGLAMNLISGKGFRNPKGNELTSMRAPLYPLFLAGIYSLFGQNFIVVGLIQSLLSALMCIFIFFIGKKVAGVRVGILSAAITAFYPELIHWAPVILTEALFIFLLCLTVLYLLKAIERPIIFNYIITGITLGLTILVRPVILFFPLLIFVWILMLKSNLISKLKTIGFILLFMSLTILPWTIRNYMVHHEFVPIATGGGLVFYAGNNLTATGGQGGYYGHKGFVFPSEQIRGLSEIEADKYLYRAGLKFIRENPKRFLELATIKFKNMWRATWTGSSKINYFFMFLSYGSLILFGIVGIVYSFAKWRRFLLLYLVIIYFILSHMLFIGIIRYRLPTIPFIIIFAAFGVSKLFKKLIIKVKD